MGIILASASPRRKALLETLGLEFRIEPGAALDEARVLQDAPGELPARLMHLAQAKGAPVARQYPQTCVLSADTVVVLDGVALGKPRDAAMAQAMLERLAGRTHDVITAVCVQCIAQQSVFQGSDQTAVTFKPLDPSTIARYIERVRPYDYAGAYAIQGIGTLLISHISGDYNNVVGLPLGLVAELLARAGQQIL